MTSYTEHRIVFSNGTVLRTNGPVDGARLRDLARAPDAVLESRDVDKQVTDWKKN